MEEHVEYVKGKDVPETLNGVDVKKRSAYALLYYVPDNFVVDFGKEKWPSPYDKKRVCPRILMVSNWTDAHFSFPGGKVEKGETPEEAINREFEEEVGCSHIQFNSDNLAYVRIIDPVRESKVEGSCKKQKTSGSANTLKIQSASRAIFCYVKTVSEVEFCKALKAFESVQPTGYCNEILAVSGIPLWMEGPEESEDIKWGNNVFGLPRFICSSCPSISPTLNYSYQPRTDLLISLMLLGICTRAEIERCLTLVKKLSIQNNQRSAENKSFTIDDIYNLPGVVDVLNEKKVNP